MKISMDGFRQSLTNDVGALKDIVTAVVDGDFNELYQKEDLINAMNQVISMSNALNCVYFKDNPDFTNMSDLRTKFIEAKETV